MPWLIAAMAGMGALSGALSNRKSARTSTQSQTQDWDATDTQSGSRRRRLFNEQLDQLQPLGEMATQQMTNPMAFLQPLKESAQQSVVNNFAAAPEVLRAKFGRGQGASGKFGGAARASELARLGQLAGVDSDFAQMVLQERQRGAQLGTQLLSLDFGDDFDTTSRSTGKRTTQGEYVGAGDPWSGMLGGAANGLFGGMLMQSMMKKK